MPEEYDDIIAAGLGTTKPRGRAHPNKIAHQPDDADWSLDRLTELDEVFRAEFGRPLPLRNKGQGSIHRKMGFDHRSSADIAVHPTSKEGQRLMAVMRERRMPFLAFTGAVPGASTGPHIHAGRPSHRTAKAANFPVGSQVRLTSKPQAAPASDDYADVVNAAVKGTDGPAADDYSDVIAAAVKRTTPPKRKDTFADVRSGAGAVPAPGIGDIRRADEAAVRARTRVSTPRPGTVEEIFARAVESTRPAGGMFTEDVLARDSELAARDVMRSRLAPPGPDEYRNYLLLNRAQDSPAMRAGFEEYRLKRTLGNNTSAVESLAAERTETARQQRVAKMSLGERAAQVPKSLVTGFAGGVGTSLKGIAALAKAIDFTGEYEGKAATDLATYQLGEEITRSARELVGSNPDLEAEFFVGRAPDTIGQMAQFILGGWATKSPKIAVALLGATMTAGDAYDEVRRAGGTDDDAVHAALLAGGILGPTELIGMRGAMRALSGTGKAATLRAAMKDAIRTGSRDSIENALQEVGQEFGQGQFTGQPRTGAQLAEAAALGAIGSGVATTGLTAIATAPEVLTPERALKEPTATVPLELQSRLARAEAIRAEETPTSQTPPPAPAVETVPGPSRATTVGPAAGALPLGVEVIPPATPANSWRVRSTAPDGSLSTQSFNTEEEANAYVSTLRQAQVPATPAEVEAEVVQAAEEIAAAPEVASEVALPRRSFADLMAERAEKGPVIPEVVEPFDLMLDVRSMTDEQVSRIIGRIADERAQLAARANDPLRTTSERDVAGEQLSELDSYSEIVRQRYGQTRGVQEAIERLVEGRSILGIEPGQIPESALSDLVEKYEQGRANRAKIVGQRAESGPATTAAQEAELSPAKVVPLVGGDKARERRVEPAIKALEAAGFTVKKYLGPNTMTFAVEDAAGKEVAKFTNQDPQKSGLALINYAREHGAPLHEQRPGEAGFLNVGGPIPEGAYYDIWYDRHTRSWVKQLKDAQGNQIGEAEYSATKPTEKSGPIKDRSGEAGFLDIGELRAGIVAGTTKLVDAVNQLRERFPDKSDGELRAMLGDDTSEPAPATVHHAILQPRTSTGQFDGPPLTGPAADRAVLSRAGAEYQRRHAELSSHQAAREGLDIVNDDVAANYFSKLRRFAEAYTPEYTNRVNEAEALYSQGKYRDAIQRLYGMGSNKNFLETLNVTSMASLLGERGVEVPGAATRANWTKVIAEVRRRMGETGPPGFLTGGSTFYDVTKHPEGGRPDHAKIAYILEPVIDAIRMDARRLIAEGKLKATDFVDYVRREFATMAGGEEMADWHPLNRAAAMSVVVDRLRTEGAPEEKKRSLPPTLEASGREGGTNRTYVPQSRTTTTRMVTERIQRDGPEKTEEWLLSREPESFAEEAERTEAFIQLSDAYQTEAVHLAATDPNRAATIQLHAISLTNRESERSVGLGQGVQAYSLLKKYEPAGALLEAMRIVRKMGRELRPEVAAEISTAAVRHQKADREVQRLKSEVAVLEAESPGGGSGTGGGPSVSGTTRRPRGESILPSKLERKREQLSEAEQRRRAAKVAVARQLKALEQSRTMAGYWKRAMNMTRGLMVSQLATAMRNLETQLVRYETERLTDLVEHTGRLGAKYSIDFFNKLVGRTMYDTVGLQSDFTYRNIWRNAIRAFGLQVEEGRLGTKNQETETRAILADHPDELARMFNTYMEAGDVPISKNWRSVENRAMRQVERVFQSGERAVEFVNFFNRLQEFHLRSAEFLAELDLHLKKERGVSLEKFIRRHGMTEIPQDLITKAVNKALEVTFADLPARDGAGGRLLNSLIEVGNYIPPTLSPAAFPRFMFNNVKFLYQYSPVGAIDLLRSGQNRPRVLARALVGTSMLLLAYQFRQSDHAGDKWYQLRFGDHIIDARPFGPFSTYLFFAEAVRRWKHGEKAFTALEIASALGASTSPGGTGMAVAEKLYDYAANGQWDKWQRVLKTEAGDLGRALLTPVRQVKDLISAFDDSQAIIRDTADQPALGPIRESIPYASTGLPEARRPTSAAPLRSSAKEGPAGIPTPIIKQFGVRIEQPRTFLESQLDELHFAPQEIRPNTGIARLDAIEKRLMGPMMDQLSGELEKDEAFKRLGKAQRASIILDAIKDIREDVRDMGRAEHPELYDQLKEERKPKRKKDLERELEQEETNSPGISRAVQLGVPLHIPARQPGEDDIAYRARLIQYGRRQRTALDTVVATNAFQAASQTEKRLLLRSAASPV